MSEQATPNGLGQQNPPKIAAPGGDVGGRWIFRLVLFLIPVGTLVVIFYITFSYTFPPSGSSSSTTVSPQARPTASPRASSSATAPISPTATSALATPGAPSLGVFDPGLGDERRFLISLLIFTVAAIVETSLLLIYGAFYVNDPVHNAQPLGLPNGTVRIFLLILVVLVLIVFAFLPDSWGQSKAVTFLFGALSTVVGFYYGSRSDGSANAPPTVLNVMPNTLTFSAKAGGTDPDPQTISVSGLPTNTSLTYTTKTSSGGQWLIVTPPSPTNLGILYARASVGTLTKDIYHGTIALTPEGASSPTVVVPIVFHVE